MTAPSGVSNMKRRSLNLSIFPARPPALFSSLISRRADLKPNSAPISRRKSSDSCGIVRPWLPADIFTTCTPTARRISAGRAPATLKPDTAPLAEESRVSSHVAGLVTSRNISNASSNRRASSQGHSSFRYVSMSDLFTAMSAVQDNRYDLRSPREVVRGYLKDCLSSIQTEDISAHTVHV